MTIDIYSHRHWCRFDGWIFRDYVDPYIVRMRAAGYRTQSICRATRTVDKLDRQLMTPS